VNKKNLLLLGLGIFCLKSYKNQVHRGLWIKRAILFCAKISLEKNIFKNPKCLAKDP
jgi:hypothetical protein